MAASLVCSFWMCATKRGTKNHNNVVMERLGVATLNVRDEWDGASLSSILHNAANIEYADAQVLEHLETGSVSTCNEAAPSTTRFTTDIIQAMSCQQLAVAVEADHGILYLFKCSVCGLQSFHISMWNRSCPAPCCSNFYNHTSWRSAPRSAFPMLYGQWAGWGHTGPFWYAHWVRKPCPLTSGSNFSPAMWP